MARKAQIIKTLQGRYSLGFVQNRPQWIMVRHGVAAKGEPSTVEIPCPRFAEKFLIF